MSDSDEDFGNNEQSCIELEEESQSEVQSEVEPITKNKGKKPLTDEERKTMQAEIDAEYQTKALSPDEKQWVIILVKYIYHTVEPAGHSGSVNIAKALEYLTGTGKEHKGWPGMDQDDVEKYLRLENIDKDDTNQELSYQQGLDLVSKLWEEDTIKKLGKKYEKSCEKKGQKWYLITIGTGHAKAKAGETKNDAQDEGEEEEGEEEAKVETPADIEYEQTLTHKDIANKITEIQEKIRWRVAFGFAHYGAPKNKYVRDDWTVKKLTDFIKKAFTNAIQVDPNPARTILYYSGEADKEGQWKCSDGVVTMKQVLDLAVEADLYGHLEIHQDSDYSGKSCTYAKEWCDANPKEKREEDIVKSVQLICNTHKDFTQEKGKHGEMYLRTKKDESMVKAKRDMEKKNYYSVYGKTKFDSTKKEDQIQEVKPENHPSQK